jgi:hypothetical protein
MYVCMYVCMYVANVFKVGKIHLKLHCLQILQRSVTVSSHSKQWRKCFCKPRKSKLLIATKFQFTCGRTTYIFQKYAILRKCFYKTHKSKFLMATKFQLTCGITTYIFRVVTSNPLRNPSLTYCMRLVTIALPGKRGSAVSETACRTRKSIGELAWFLGSMLWSQFSAIFDNCRRKDWRFSH